MHRMTYRGVFWYGVVVLVLSAIAGAQGGGALTAVFAMAVNWTVFVLPVLLIRNARDKRKARVAVD